MTVTAQDLDHPKCSSILWLSANDIDNVHFYRVVINELRQFYGQVKRSNY